jgi:hypothetical protein
MDHIHSFYLHTEEAKHTHKHIEGNERMTDSEQVPRGKDAKNFEKRVRKYQILLKRKERRKE